MRVASPSESEIRSGPVNVLAMLCEARMDVQRTRLALEQRGLSKEAAEFAKSEARLDRGIKKELQGHIIWPWLSQYPGLGGVQTARLISLIGDPTRFPGRKCTEGHTLPNAGAGREDEVVVGVGSPCPWVGLDDQPCPGTLLEPRAGTGVRSLWHYLGLHVVDGRSPRKAKGSKADWSPVGRTVVLMPGGIADSIIKLRVPVYRDEYDRQKERLQNERGVDSGVAIEGPAGPAQPNEPIDADLRPFQIHERARKIAAKKFVGDLLIEWKRLLTT